MNVLAVFDDTVLKSEVIKDVIGEKGFSGVVVRKRTLEDYYRKSLEKLYPECVWQLVHSVFEFPRLAGSVEKIPEEDIKIIHCFSNFIISDEQKVLLSYEKLRYMEEDYQVLCGRKTAAVMFCGKKSYMRFLKLLCAGQTSLDAAKTVEDFMETDGLVDISIVSNFIQCITGNFESRYFNSLHGDEYTIVKSSSNKTKIKSEYTYYHLLPDDMKMWYVMPFHYQENSQTASYSMERLHMTDLAVKWVHGSIDVLEFEEILDKYFYFFKCRHSKKVTEDEYRQAVSELYVRKVADRIEELKMHKAYSAIARFMEAGCKEHNIDGLVKKYMDLKAEIEKKNRYPSVSVIGHGDPCFANALYNKSTKMLKFIDPKGALDEPQLWTDPYYDIAKLSHSVCGRYDFFNNALFEIRINDRFECELNIEFDHSIYVELFKKKLEENGYDYLTVRIYEASLFLSMLPLHMDYPHKVFGFILNVQDILKEIEKSVS